MTFMAQRRMPRRLHPLFVAVVLGYGCSDAVSPARVVGKATAQGEVATPLFVTLSAGHKPGKDPQEGRLAFAAWTGMAPFIYTMLPNGSRLAGLTEGRDPSWSPDGRRIAFWRDAREGAGIYVMEGDGSNIRRISPDGYQPTWSPDGHQLAFGCGGICVINLDGTGRAVLTAPEIRAVSPTNCIRDSDPSWSPDGRTIAFTRWPAVAIPTSLCLPLGVAMSFPFDFWTEIWFVEADGTSLRGLQDADGNPLTYAGWPAWSPDGSQLAFYRESIGVQAIAVVNADGSGLRDISRRTPSNWDEFLGGPDWSPDGKRIVLGSAANWGFADALSSMQNPDFKSRVQLPSRFIVWSWSRR